jgi:hypothetical protein
MSTFKLDRDWIQDRFFISDTKIACNVIRYSIYFVTYCISNVVECFPCDRIILKWQEKVMGVIYVKYNLY